MGKKSKWRAF
ncbi:hypothetical protein CAEBREN_15113 [Caenorhabditis brenneri]|uniref:Uncharacterized protein n=1 Tax=Caenorhabditis brenneri TaxID=135651 RepID=G0M718_CAEBE|nr:hypothetical protein CAEBREN_15113 [Caenorhabditis brenneri]